MRAETTFDRRVSKEDFGEMPVLLPPNAVQRQIAAYLDRKTRTVDALTAVVNRRLAALQQRMLSALSHELAASGGATRLKNAARVNQASLPASTQPDARFRYVDISSVDSWGQIRPGDEMTFESAPSRARRLARPGDIVLSTVRTYLRAIASVPSPADDLVFSTGFAVLSPCEGVEPRFLRWALQSSEFLDEVVARSVGINYPSVNIDDLMDIRIVVPPMTRQRAIADRFDRTSEAVRRVAQATKEELDTLAERRQALVTAAVTGQIEIAGEAA
jgi:type I restriction enzyme S subunit